MIFTYNKESKPNTPWAYDHWGTIELHLRKKWLERGIGQPTTWPMWYPIPTYVLQRSSILECKVCDCHNRNQGVMTSFSHESEESVNICYHTPFSHFSYWQTDYITSNVSYQVDYNNVSGVPPPSLVVTTVTGSLRQRAPTGNVSQLFHNRLWIADRKSAFGSKSNFTHSGTTQVSSSPPNSPLWVRLHNPLHHFCHAPSSHLPTESHDVTDLTEIMLIRS